MTIDAVSKANVLRLVVKATTVKATTEGVYEVVRLDVNYGPVHVQNHQLAQIQMDIRQTLSHVNAEPILVLVVQPSVPALLTRVVSLVVEATTVKATTVTVTTEDVYEQ